jgi:uncharacterized membrane protein
MNTKRKSQHEQIEMMVVTAILTALVAVLAYFGGFVKIGGLASVSLVLIPIVIGSAMYGPLVGAWLGGVSGLVFFATPDAAFWMGLSIPGTIITVMVKGILAGFFAGLVYNALKKINRYFAVIVAAVVCPVVNTSIFIGGCFVFFMDVLKSGAAAEGMGIGGYLIVAFVGLNFVFELLFNVVCSPAILRIINIREKKH